MITTYLCFPGSNATCEAKPRCRPCWRVSPEVSVTTGLSVASSGRGCCAPHQACCAVPRHAVPTCPLHSGASRRAGDTEQPQEVGHPPSLSWDPLRRALRWEEGGCYGPAAGTGCLPTISLPVSKSEPPPSPHGGAGREELPAGSRGASTLIFYALHAFLWINLGVLIAILFVAICECAHMPEEESGASRNDKIWESGASPECFGASCGGNWVVVLVAA